MRNPRATYRIQLSPAFDLDAAAGVTDYLAALGISHLYASPYLQAAAGSTHGYDVVDPTRVSRELGGEAAHGRLVAALERNGLGQVLDIVANHMAVTGRENAWWWDVLRNGPASVYAHFFDVDWHPPEPKLRERVLLPVLGDHYGRELEAGRIRVERGGGELTVRYREQVLPLSPASLGALLAAAASVLEREDPRSAGELAFLARALTRLREPAVGDGDARRSRQQDVAVVDERLAELLEADRVVASLDGVVAGVNGDTDALDVLLEAQNYRLAYWRAAREELDYRRFFDINSLAALHTEDPQVFSAVHGRVLSMVAEGVLDGIRVDHPDGLRDPAGYFRRLRAEAPGAWIVVEKVLSPDEVMRPWPVDGTTGYDALSDLTGVFLDPAGEGPLTDLWQAITGDRRGYADVAYAARKDILRDILGADLNRLAQIFVELCEDRRRYRDFTRQGLREALAEVAACFPVYRAYAVEEGGGVDADREVVELAVANAAVRRPMLDPELLTLLRSILLGEEGGEEARRLRERFQQFTGAVAAKGEEDTAFYRYNRFVALNEVGSDPGRWALPVAAFHGRCARRAEAWPASMTTLSTHDTKRSEDVRARLLVLAEVTERWAAAVARWRGVTGVYWAPEVPRDAALEYLFFQTMVGAWPIGPQRLLAYMEKAAREAKLRTSWLDPDEAFESALSDYVTGALAGPLAGDVGRFVAGIAGAGRVNSLGQKLVQLTMPGVPDLYQGSELWDLSLVDPDNRRPVDFEVRRRLLEEVREASVRDVLAGMTPGTPKLRVVYEALQMRKRVPEAFEPGSDYVPLDVRGPASRHVLAFVRGGRVATVVARLPVGLARLGGWRGTRLTLPSGQWRDAFTGARLAGGETELRRILGRFPVSLLEREGGQ